VVSRFFLFFSHQCDFTAKYKANKVAHVTLKTDPLKLGLDRLKLGFLGLGLMTGLLASSTISMSLILFSSTGFAVTQGGQFSSSSSASFSRFLFLFLGSGLFFDPSFVFELSSSLSSPEPEPS
jgi:hypothetical protein